MGDFRHMNDPEITGDRIASDAFGFESKTVPLVVYGSDGERHVIGEATLTAEAEGRLRIVGTVMDPQIAQILARSFGDMSSFAIANNPAKPEDPASGSSTSDS